MYHKSRWSQDVMTLVCLWISLDYANGAVGCSKTSLSPQQLLYLGILRLEGQAVALWCRGVIESDGGGGVTVFGGFFPRKCWNAAHKHWK